MMLLRRIRLRLAGIFKSGKFNAAMEAEMKMHLTLRVEKNVAAGMAADEVHSAALRTE
jgi:hypothetical protein